MMHTPKSKGSLTRSVAFAAAGLASLALVASPAAAAQRGLPSAGSAAVIDGAGPATRGLPATEALPSTEAPIVLAQNRGRNAAIGAAIVGGVVAGAIIAGAAAQARAEERERRARQNAYRSHKPKKRKPVKKTGGGNSCQVLLNRCNRGNQKACGTYDYRCLGYGG